MPKNNGEHTWVKLMPIIWLVIVSLIGSVLVARFSGFWKEIGFAFIVAAIIGIVIELTFVTRLAKNVFEIAFGYLLPPDLRPSMRWIYNQKIVCTKHTQIVEIIPSEKSSNIVVIKTTLQRTLQNISNAPTKIAVGMSVDELFVEGEQSDIIDMGYHTGKTHKTNLETNKRRAGNARLVVDREDVPLDRDGTIDVWCTFQEVRQRNDNQDLFLKYATQEPSVTVKIPPSFEYDVGFQYAGDEDTEPIRLGENTWKLPMTLLPTQAINIRWWEKDKATQWEDKKK